MQRGAGRRSSGSRERAWSFAAGRVELAFCLASALTCRAAAVLQPPSAVYPPPPSGPFLVLFFLLLATMRVKSVGIALECFAFRVHIIRARALLTHGEKNCQKGGWHFK